MCVRRRHPLSTTQERLPLKLFTYRDLRAESAQNPFPSINGSTAIRETREHIEAGRLTPTYASDFALYQIASYDPETMRVTPNDPKHIIDVIEIVKDINDNG